MGFKIHLLTIMTMNYTVEDSQGNGTEMEENVAFAGMLGTLLRYL